MFLFIFGQMLIFRLLVTVVLGLVPAMPGRNDPPSLWHLSNFATFLLGIAPNVVSCIIIYLSVIYGPISYLHDYALTSIPLIRIPILLALAQLIDQIIVFLFECLSRLNKTTRELVPLLPIKKRLKNYLADFGKGLAYDFTFFAVLAILHLALGGGTLYMLALILLMVVKAKVVTPLWRFI